MRQVFPDLFVGTVSDLSLMRPAVNLSRIHHYRSQGWGMSKFEDHRLDPTYLIYENQPDFLSVNWVDGREELFDYQGKGVRTCQRILDFLEANNHRSRLIVCDHGLSRSPAMAVLYLAKREQVLPNNPADAFDTYHMFDPSAVFSPGIVDFLHHRWEEIQ